MRRGWALLSALVAIGFAFWWWGLRDGDATRAARAPDAAAAVRGAPPAAAMSPVETQPAPDAAEVAAAPPGQAEEAPVTGLDLERLRKTIPDHSYWKLLAPTEDKELLAWREQRARELNVLYGKVLSGTGTEQEITAYFEERRRISEDAITFASAVIVEMGDELGERERGMLDLAITLHKQRLEELPRRIADAEQRKKEQDARREEWLRTGK